MKYTFPYEGMHKRIFRLPEKYLITGENPLQKANFLRRLEKCLSQGYRLFQLRAKNITTCQYQQLALESIDLCKNYNAVLMVNCAVEDAISLKIESLHLTSVRLMSLNVKPMKFVSASCHDFDQINKANELKLDFITISPILPTQTHPGVQPMGWDMFSRLCRTANMPVFALGGLIASDIEIAKTHGAYGISAIRGFWMSSH